MAIDDIKTNNNELREHLQLILQIPERLNELTDRVKKELILDVEKRISNLSSTICAMIEVNENYSYPESYLPDRLFEYWAERTSSQFTYNELMFLRKLLIQNIEIEVPKEAETENKNPFPLLFINYDVYNCFLEYTKRHIIDFHPDYSYLKKRLEAEKLIHYHKDTDFLEIIYKEMRLIKEYQYNKYFTKFDSKFSSLTKSYSEHRENNFNYIFGNLIKSK